MKSAPPTLPPHQLKIALLHPQIAPNTGNVARLCVATGTQLHLVRPLGFVLTDRELKRSAMDYWPRLKLTVHDDEAAFFAAQRKSAGRLWLLTSKALQPLWDAKFSSDDWILLGNETQGLPESLLADRSADCLRIPQVENERCLNLSTATGIALFEALRQIASPPRA
jgi:tRNA (cytidine/uridine-2'-O-)-methyltransferase